MYDVVISGAGPSGSQCAEVLAKAGYSVMLIEKDTKWCKPCGGGLNHRVLYSRILNFILVIPFFEFPL